MENIHFQNIIINSPYRTLKGSYKSIWPYDYTLHISKDFWIFIKHKDRVLIEGQELFHSPSPLDTQRLHCTPALTVLTHLYFFPEVAGKCIPGTRTLVQCWLCCPAGYTQPSLTGKPIKMLIFEDPDSAWRYLFGELLTSLGSHSVSSCRYARQHCWWDKRMSLPLHESL